MGGHVESLESGVFRSDLPCKFKVDPKSYQQLIDNIDRALTFSVEAEYVEFERVAREFLIISHFHVSITSEEYHSKKKSSLEYELDYDENLTRART